MLSAALAACVAGVCLAAAPFENMNGEYLTTPTPNAPKGATYNTRWSEYDTEHGGVEYFEVELGPIESLYSEVWWEAFPAVPLPPTCLARPEIFMTFSNILLNHF